MKSTDILQKLTAESGEGINLIYSRLLVEKVDFPDTLFEPDIPVQNQYCTVMPPIIVCKKNSRYTIIDGCKRLVLLRRRKIEEADFAIIDSVCDSFVYSLLRILLNRGRTLLLKEKILFLNWLKVNLDDQEYKRIVCGLGISDKERFELERLLTCALPVLNAVDSGVADCTVASDLNSMSTVDRDAFLSLFSKVSFSRQQQRELIEWLPEIAFTEQCSVHALLGEITITEILENGSINQPQKAQKIRDQIFKKRFPNLVELKQRWSALVNKVNPDPARIHFNVSEFFEKNRLEVKLTLNEAQKAGELFAKLGSISNETWEKLIYPAK